MKQFFFTTTLLLLLVPLSICVAGQKEVSMGELAQKSNNPLSDIWMLYLQNDYTWIDGDKMGTSKVMNNTKFQPVMPLPVMDDQWNLIIRPVFQFVSSPFDEKLGGLLGMTPSGIRQNPGAMELLEHPYDRTNGLGDTVLLTLLGPNRNDGLIMGGGLTQIFPTATEDILGQEKWQAGPAFLIARMGTTYGGLGLDNWFMGALFQQWWSYAGPDDRSSTNQMDLQYFIFWRATETMTIGMSPNARIDWDADSDDKLTLPIGLGVYNIVTFGPLPVRMGAEVQYYLTQPDDIGPTWNFRLTFSPLILNPLK